MQVNNQTSDPVEYVQNGSGAPLPEDRDENGLQSGQLAAHTETQPFVPTGRAPYNVVFTAEGHKPATSCDFSDPVATVTLNDDWSITVSSGCD